MLATMLAVALAAVPSLDEMCGEWQSAGEIDATAPLSSLAGSCIAGRDVLSVGACVFPPFTMFTNSYQYMAPPYEDPLRPGHGEPGLPDPYTGWSGRLLLDGAPVLAERSRWCAHRVEREAEAAGVRVRTSVSLAAAAGGGGSARAVLFNILLTPLHKSGQAAHPRAHRPSAPASAAASLSTRVSLELQGLGRAFPNRSAWTFAHPTVLQNETGQFEVAALPARAGVLVRDTRSAAGVALVASRAAETLTLGAPAAGSARTLIGGRAEYGQPWVRSSSSFELALALTIGGEAKEAQAEAERLAGSDAGFAAAVSAASALWEARWQDAFAVGNARYSGHWPSVAGDADVCRLYHLSALSMLAVERRVVDPSVAWPQAFATGGPRTGATTCYFWDMAYQQTMLTLLEPRYVRKYVLAALGSGLHSAYEINYMSGKGEGRWCARARHRLSLRAATETGLPCESWLSPRRAAMRLAGGRGARLLLAQVLDLDAAGAQRRGRRLHQRHPQDALRLPAAAALRRGQREQCEQPRPRARARHRRRALRAEDGARLQRLARAPALARRGVDGEQRRPCRAGDAAREWQLILCVVQQCYPWEYSPRY
jgi:hypothetical protein